MSAANRLDWTAALDKLRRIQMLIERSETRTPEQLRQIYEDRAKRLAAPLEAIEGSGAEELVIFRLGPERFAFRVGEVSEVLRECQVTAVPGAPEDVAGVIQVRAEIRPVYSLRRKLGLEGEEAAGGAVILMRVEGRQFGVRVDAIEEIRTVQHDARRPVSEAGHVAWRTEDLAGVLNARLLWTKES